MSKNVNAVKLGKLGGKRRAAVLDPDRRREIARNAGIASGISRQLTAKNINRANSQSNDKIAENKVSNNS